MFGLDAGAVQCRTATREERCEDLEWWFQAHEARIAKLAIFYRGLGTLAYDITLYHCTLYSLSIGQHR